MFIRSTWILESEEVLKLTIMTMVHLHFADYVAFTLLVYHSLQLYFARSPPDVGFFSLVALSSH